MMEPKFYFTSENLNFSHVSSTFSDGKYTIKTKIKSGPTETPTRTVHIKVESFGLPLYVSALSQSIF
jgi:hypothetical protein